MEADVIEFPGLWHGNIDGKKVLKAASKAGLVPLLVCGVDEVGELYFASSTPDKTALLYMLDLARHKLLDGDYDL